MSDDLAPGHGNQRPHRIGDGDIGEHDNANETGTGQRFAAYGRGRCVDTCEIVSYSYQLARITHEPVRVERANVEIVCFIFRYKICIGHKIT